MLAHKARQIFSSVISVVVITLVMVIGVLGASVARAQMLEDHRAPAQIKWPVVGEAFGFGCGFQKVAQTFIPRVSGPLQHIKVWLRRSDQIGTNTARVTMSLAGGTPDLGAVLETSSTVWSVQDLAIGSLEDPATPVTFAFSGTHTLAAGHRYSFILDTTGYTTCDAPRTGHNLDTLVGGTGQPADYPEALGPGIQFGMPTYGGLESSAWNYLVDVPYNTPGGSAYATGWFCGGTNRTDCQNAADLWFVVNPPPLGFPLAGQSPGTAQVVSIFDHAMQNKKGVYGPYTCDQKVQAFDGQVGSSTSGVSDTGGNCQSHPGYPQDGHRIFTLEGVEYVGSGGHPEFLNYDGHPGIDFRAPEGTPVSAVVSGTISYPKSIVGFNKKGHAGKTYHILELRPDDRPDLRIYYVHLQSYPKDKDPNAPDPVTLTDDGECPPTVTIPIPEGAAVQKGCLIKPRHDLRYTRVHLRRPYPPVHEDLPECRTGYRRCPAWVMASPMPSPRR